MAKQSRTRGRDVTEVIASHDGSYQLSHIYDNLFARNLSGERRLDRPFRRRLQSRPKRQHQS